MNLKIRKKDEIVILKMYDKYEKISTIARKFGVSPITINAVLRRHGVKRRSLGERNLHLTTERINRYFDSHSVSECISRFANKRLTFANIMTILKDRIVINDDFINDVFFERDGTISSNRTRYVSKHGDEPPFTEILEYLKNRFDDSDSTKETLLRIRYKRYEKPMCPECGKRKVNFTANRFVFTKFCGRKCSRRNKESQETYRRTLTEKYGRPNYNNLEKNRKTCMERYGVENVFMADWCKEKIAEHWQDAFGVDNPMQVASILKKAQDTNVREYGNITFLHSKKGEERIRASMREKYDCDYTTQNPSLLKKVIERRKISNYDKVFVADEHVEPLFDSEYYSKHYKEKLPFRCKHCGGRFEDHPHVSSRFKRGDVRTLARCPKCFPVLSGYSRYETEVIDFISTFTDSKCLWRTKTNRKILNGQEIDIYFPKEKIGIEFDGVYWHSTEYKRPGLHIDKTVKCENLGIRLVHIFEDDWLKKRDYVCDIIYKLFKNSVDFGQGDEIVVDRAFFNKCCVPEGYELVREIGPKIVKRSLPDSHVVYDVEDCGQLVYRKSAAFG